MFSETSVLILKVCVGILSVASTVAAIILKGWRFVLVVVSVLGFVGLGYLFFWSPTSASPVEMSRREFYEAGREVYGLSRDNFYRTVRLYENGDADHSMYMSVKAICQNVDEIEMTYSVPHTVNVAKFVDTLTSCSNGSSLIMVRKDSSMHDVIHKLKFDPAIAKGQTASLDKWLTWESTNSFAMTYEVFESRDMKTESAGMWIKYPCDTVRITIVFPKGYKPKGVGFDAWYGAAEVRCKTEYEALQEMNPPVLESKTDNARQETLTLTVPYPIIGLTYAITWKPEDTPIKDL